MRRLGRASEVVGNPRFSLLPRSSKVPGQDLPGNSQIAGKEILGSAIFCTACKLIIFGVSLPNVG